MNGTKIEAVMDYAGNILNNKQSRSLIILIAAFTIVLAINAVLPVIEGDAHYTAEAIETTYGEYLDMKEENVHYRLSWASEKLMDIYVYKYIDKHPELSPDEQMLITVPDGFKVKVYTKFFYQYPFWYIGTITSLASSVLLFYALFNYLITKGKEKYARYVELSTELDKLVDSELDPVTFEPWVHDEFNRRRKIKQHLSNIKYDLDALERNTRYDVKHRFREFYKVRGTDKEYEIDVKALRGRDLKYYKRREKLLELLDATYIKEYVANGYVKRFKYVYPMFVLNGTNTVGHTTDSYSLITSDHKRITSDAGGKIVLSLVITVLFAVLFTVTAVASYQQSPFWIVINILAKIVPLLIQIPLAFDYSNAFMTQQLIGNLMSRRSISYLYLADMQKQGTKIIDPTLQKEIDKEVEKNAEKN